LLRSFKAGLPVSPALVYVFFAALMGMACVLLTPPGQTPDERNHLARITQISQGGLIGLKLGTNDAGGYLPADFPAESELLNSLRFNAQAKVQMNELLALSERRWDQKRIWVSFPNTVIYAPITYIPGAITTALARAWNATILQTSYAVRTVNVVFTIVLCALGIGLARRGTLYLAVLASLPMVIAVGASCSQDGILIGLSIVTAALLTRLDAQNPGSRHFWIAISCLFAVLTVSKPPLLLCSLIPLGFRLPGKMLDRAMPFLASALAFLIWQKIGLNPTKIQFLDGSGTSDSGQVHWVLTHPLSLPMLAYTTLKVNLGHNIHEFIGVLGWLDTLFPAWFYRIVYLTIAGTLCFCLYPAFANRALAQNAKTAFVTVLAMLLAVGAVYFSLYVIWTPVGAPIIDGVQGRYFLPIAPFLALVFPRVCTAGQVADKKPMHQVAMLGFSLFLIVDVVTLTCELASRYW